MTITEEADDIESSFIVPIIDFAEAERYVESLRKFDVEEVHTQQLSYLLDAMSCFSKCYYLACVHGGRILSIIDRITNQTSIINKILFFRSGHQPGSNNTVT